MKECGGGLKNPVGWCGIFTVDYGVGAAACFERDVLICQRKNSGTFMCRRWYLKRCFFTQMAFYA
jgi:hypothetical protein